MLPTDGGFGMAIDKRQTPSTMTARDEVVRRGMHNQSERTPPKGTEKKGLLQTLGPGLVTGASDDDPSGIATYSQVGAQFGFSMLWTLLFSYPLMAAIQEISARIGRVTGRGIAGNLRKYYHPAFAYVIIPLMVIANVINLGADIGAMGASAAMLTGAPALSMAALLTIISFTLQAIAPYEKYASWLKWMTLALFAYVATVFVIHVPWMHALRATVTPSIPLNATFITSLVAVLGTTISPYLFFWQAGQEVEIEKANPEEEALKKAPAQAPSQLYRIRVDTYSGMAISNIVSFFIMLTAAWTLHRHGITDVQTATQAAEALHPLAGQFAYLLFAVGIIGTGMLALPVLSASAAYAVGEALHWPVGLAREPLQARGFYGVLAISMFVGLGLNMMHVSAIKALFWSAVINGLVAPPIMILMMLMASNAKVMGGFAVSNRLKFMGWLSTLAMTAAAMAMVATFGH
jgi:NRAMP (natural resistance-associated macrophage protein)-like metal ion transporter